MKPGGIIYVVCLSSLLLRALTQAQVTENPWQWQKPDTTSNLAWERKVIEGFAWPASIRPGDSLHLFSSVYDMDINSSAGQNYDIRIFKTAGTDSFITSRNADGIFFPLHDSAGGLIQWGDYSRRPVDYKRGCLQDWQTGRQSFPNTTGWPSGIYYAKLIHRTDTTKYNYIPFVVRSSSPGNNTKILLKYDLNTFQAYNYWGGGSLYSSSQDPTLALTDTIALDRPLTFTQAEAHTYFIQSFLRTMNDGGYAIDYCNNIDLDKPGPVNSGFGIDLLSKYSLLILWIHDEYWSQAERNVVEAFKGNQIDGFPLHLHGNIARFAPNTCYWRVAWEGGPSGLHQQLTCRKGYLGYPTSNPPYDLWRWNGTGGLGNPENKFLASQYQTGYNVVGDSIAEEPPDSIFKHGHWIFRGTGLTAGQVFGLGFLDTLGRRHGIVSGELDNTTTDRDSIRLVLDTLAQRYVISRVDTGSERFRPVLHQMIYAEDTVSNSRVFAQGASNWWVGLQSNADDTSRMRIITLNIISHFSGKKYIGKVWTSNPLTALEWTANIELDGNVQIPPAKYLKALGPVTITVDSTFAIDGTLEINGNVTIAGPGQVIVGATGVIKVMDGATLTIAPTGQLYSNANAQFKMGSGSSITVNGVFHAEGSVNDSVKFSSAQGASAWNGISAYNTQLTSSADFLLDYVEISGASRAVHVRTSMPAVISNSTINGTTEMAIEIVPNLANSGSSNEDVLIDHVTINTDDGDGIVVVNTSLAKIQGCTLNGQTQESTAGFRFDNASPVIVGTKIENFYYGVLAVTNSTPVFQDGQFGGYNIIRNNIIGVQCEESNAVLGISDPQTDWEGGMNSIYDNESYNIVLVKSEVYAQNNWWGDAQGPDLNKFSIDDGSNLYYEPWLEYDPNSGSAPLKAGGTTIASLKEIKSAVSSEENTPEPMTQRMGNRQMQEAIAQLRNIVESASESLYVKKSAVTELLSNTGRLRTNGNSNYLRNLQNEQLQIKVRATLPATLVEERSVTQAATEWNQNITSSNNNLRRSGLYGRFMLALYKDGNVSDATTLHNRLQSEYQNSSQTKLAERQLRLAQALQSNSPLGRGSSKNIAGNEASSVIQKPKEFALRQNYPNPFNPTTTIKYDLPVDKHVSLKVYDVLGREVLTLMDEEQQAGYHSAVFDASRFSSGMYFYRLTAGTYVSTRKLLLLR